jgi:amino-acid N-acetyltransferase
VSVDPGYRNQGLGEMLVEATLERAGRLELRAVYLLTTTARDYFTRRGFVDCRREEAPEAIRGSWEFRVGCPATAVLMKRPRDGA